jgi:adenylate cyclase
VKGTVTMTRAGWRRRRKTLLLVAAALLAVAVGALAYATETLRRSELQTIDARFSIRGPQTVPKDIVLVLIDDATLRELAQRHLQSEFPFPRKYDAAVIEGIRRAGAKAIAVDIQFTQRTDEADDQALAEAIEQAHGKIALATTDVARNGETKILGGNAVVRELGAVPASAVLTVDSDGTVRRFPHDLHGLDSLAVATNYLATGHEIPRARFEDGNLPIAFAGPPETIKSISFSKVLTGQYSPGQFAGKIVIVGASASVLQDVHATATSASSQMPGPEIWANAISTLLRGIPLSQSPAWFDVLLIVLMGSLAPVASLRLRPSRALAGAAVFAVAVQLAFDAGHIVSLVYPLLALAISTLAMLAVLYMTETMERERVHDLFARFVPSDVVEEVVARTDDNLRLGAVRRECTVLFSDLRGFTGFSEKLPAERVIEVVNYYLNEMTEAILGAGGTLISYMGDGIMAVFGAPLEQPDHADRGVAAAVEMVGPRLARFNAWLAEQGHDHRFAMGVGLNSGLVMAGNIGAEDRVEYTALGDTTNTASRLEGMTKGSGHMLFIADATRERLRGPRADLELVGELPVRGRVEPVPVWTIADGPPGATDANAQPDASPADDELAPPVG